MASAERADVRGWLVVNPEATRTSPAVVAVVARTLSRALQLEVRVTDHRGHARRLVTEAVRGGADVIVAFGGDGTLNEVIQALAGTAVQLAPVPGGSTNVLVRNLGLPPDPITAAGALLERIRSGTTRTIALGRANGRYFAANAGLGFDAAVVRRVQAHPRMKRAAPDLAFVWSVLRVFLFEYERRRLPITLHLCQRAPQTGFGSTIVCNVSPYTYVGRRPLRVTPDAAADRGLALVGVRTLDTAATVRLLLRSFTGREQRAAPATATWSDLACFTLRSDVPLPLQVDGEFVGECREARFQSVPDALTVLA